MIRSLVCVLGLFLVTASSQVYAAEAETLARQLEAQAKASREKTPAEVAQVMDEAIEALRKSQIVEKALKAGASFPVMKLKDAQGAKFDTAALLKKGPLILVFYRGGWCPYCMVQLAYWNNELADVRAKGATFVAITPENSTEAKATIAKRGWEFPVVLDEKSKLARKLGIVYPMPESLIAVYRKFGRDLSATNTSESWELPISATYVVGTDGKIVYAHIDPDYKKRAEPAEVLKSLGQKSLRK